MKKSCKIIVCIFVILQIVLLTSLTALALEPFESKQECTLVINYMYEEKPIIGASFDIYRVADISTDKVMTLSGDFKNSGIELNGLDNEGFNKAARSLQKSIDKATPNSTVKTDDKGNAVSNKLEAGVYLIIGKPITAYERVHYTMPQLVILPYENTVENRWDYQVTLSVKSIPVNIGEKPKDLSVIKKWDDNGYELQRPTAITVHLLLNGEIYDTVVLSKQTQWQYKWTNLLPIGKWTVSEEVPADYVLEITENETGFILLNSHRDIEQTGQLWWPVPVLILVGFSMIASGVILRRGKNNEA